MTELEVPQNEHWTVDRRVPLSLFAGMLIQTCITIWVVSGWVTAMDARVKAVEVASAASVARIERVEGDSQRMQVAAATVSAQLQALRDSLVEVKDGQREQIELLRDYIKGVQP